MDRCFNSYNFGGYNGSIVYNILPDIRKGICEEDKESNSERRLRKSGENEGQSIEATAEKDEEIAAATGIREARQR